MVGALGRDGAEPLAAPVAPPVREDPERFRLGVGVPELRARAGEERHGLLAEGVLDARAVEGRGERAPDLPQPVEEAVGVALALQEPGRRHREGDLDRERLERAEQRRAEGPGTAGAESDEDADDLAAGRERNGDEAERPRKVLRGLGRRDELEAASRRRRRRAGGRTTPPRRGARRGRAAPRRGRVRAGRPPSSRTPTGPGAGRAGGAARRRGRGRSGSRSPRTVRSRMASSSVRPPSAAWTRLTNATRSALRRSASTRRAFSSAPAARRASSWTRRISCGVRTKAPRRDIVRKPKTVSPCSSGMARRRRRRGPLLSSASASSSSKAGP